MNVKRGARRRNITRLMNEGDEVDAAVAQAVRDAVLMHKRLGNPISTVRDGRVVWVAPQDIEVGSGTNGRPERKRRRRVERRKK